MDIKKILDSFARHKTNVAGFDIGDDNIKAVRMHRAGDTIILDAADIIPLTNTNNNQDNAEQNKQNSNSDNITIPEELKAQYGCLAISSPQAIIKLLSFPGKPDDKTTDKVINSMGIKDLDNFRINYKITDSGDTHNESRILTVALPEADANRALSFFPTGIPAPFTLEISGLATISSFLTGHATRHTNEAIGIIDFGDNISTFALFNKGNIALLRRFNFGTHKIIARIMDTLGVDKKTATDILDEGSFDISMVTDELLLPIANQLAISRDFIERRENCHVSCLYISGELSQSQNTTNIIRKSMHIDIHTWLPTEGITVNKETLPENFKEQEWRFAAAIGACLATLEKS